MTTSPSNSSSSSLRRSSRTRRPAHTVYDDAAAKGAEAGSGKKRKVYVFVFGQLVVPVLVVGKIILTSVTSVLSLSCIAVILIVKRIMRKMQK